LKTQLNLTDMLRPAVQPGSKIDYELPLETVTIGFKAGGDARVRVGGEASLDATFGGGRTEGTITAKPRAGEVVPVEVRFMRLGLAPSLSFWFSTNEDKSPRAFPLHRVLVPWANTRADLAKPVEVMRPKELDGGSWARGRQVFFGEPAGCFK